MIIIRGKKNFLGEKIIKKKLSFGTPRAVQQKRAKVVNNNPIAPIALRPVAIVLLWAGVQRSRSVDEDELLWLLFVVVVTASDCRRGSIRAINYV